MLRDSLTERKSGSQSFLSVFDPKVTSEKASPPQSLPHKAKMGTELPVWKTCGFTDPSHRFLSVSNGLCKGLKWQASSKEAWGWRAALLSSATKHPFPVKPDRSLGENKTTFWGHWSSLAASQQKSMWWVSQKVLSGFASVWMVSFYLEPSATFGAEAMKGEATAQIYA